MISCYLDTSFLIKLYVYENDSLEAARSLAASKAKRVINRLTGIEVATTFRRKSLDGYLTASESQMAVGSFNEDMSVGLYDRKPVGEAVFALAEDLVERHGDFIRLRSLDLLHVATALHYGIDGFATYDVQLRVLVERVGLELLQ
ncbi:MAG TPA: type II toxin-antitoxin system VapC family toxin [Acidobacteriaceae bacterium]